jgi:DNA mismatch endonuclease, patch repair protein
MADKISKEQRSLNMARIRGTDTRPERIVRSLLHRAGFRFRKNVKSLPGKPDIILPKYKMAIFVHGCFWHQHPGCHRSTVPKTNRQYWIPKLSGNVERDKKHLSTLESLGWNVQTIWECEANAASEVVLALIEKLTSCVPES